MASVIKVDNIQSDTGKISIGATANAATEFLYLDGGSSDSKIELRTNGPTAHTALRLKTANKQWILQNYMGTGSLSGTSDTLRIYDETGGGERFSFANTGVFHVYSGVKFPTSQNASSDGNTLDDYEEGTFTPILSSGSPTYSGLSGSYTKIGRMVHCQISIDAGVNAALIVPQDTTFTGLPFNVSHTTSAAAFETFNPAYAANSPNYVNFYIFNTYFRSQSAYSRSAPSGGNSQLLLLTFSYITST